VRVLSFVDSLPVDLYRNILHDLKHDKEVLAHLMLTCKALYEETAQSLYRYVELWDIKTTKMFLTSVSNNPDNAKHVRTLISHSPLKPRLYSEHSRLDEAQREIMDLWIQALEKMVNLKSFGMLGIEVFHREIRPWLARCTSSRLRSLRNSRN